MIKLIITMVDGAKVDRTFNDAQERDDYISHIEENKNWGEGCTYETVDATAEIAEKKLKKLFTGIRNLWQELSDDFAARNALLGITQAGKTKEVSDKFSKVIYYLNCNAPLEAVKELDLIVLDNVFITSDQILLMKNKLLGFINA